MSCKFTIAWVGECGNETIEGEDFCTEHFGLKCSSCGTQATHSCSETIGAFVCGALLCNDCEHRITPGGTNGGVSRHVKKDEQEYEPWYMRKKEATE